MGQAAIAAALLAALHDDGAQHFDPVRFRFLEALARRLPTQEGEARRLLANKLSDAAQAYQQRFIAARQAAAAEIDRVAAQYPQAVAELRCFFAAGDFNEVRRRIAGLERAVSRSLLAGLTERLGEHNAPPAPAASIGGQGDRGDHAPAADGAPAELKSVRYFRQTWAKLSIDRQIDQALANGPENAGPLNSHLLVLRSLALLRDSAPAYLSRLVPYVDALLWLDRVDHASKAPAKAAATGEANKKPKGSRAKAR